MAILPSARYASVTLAFLIIFQIQPTSSSSFDVVARSSAPPALTVAPHLDMLAQRDKKTTCDDSHGVFTCLVGSCYYDDTGAFACCDGTNECTAIQTCIPSGKRAGGKTCSKGNEACMSCTDSKLPNCYTITNEGMSHSALSCADTGGSQVVSFTFDMDHITQTVAPSTFVGAPVPISSDPATLVGPPAQPSSTPLTSTSISTLTLTTSTRSSISTVNTVSAIVTVSRLVPVASQDPSPDDGHSHQLPGTTIGGIAVGAIAGVCLLWGCLSFLYGRHKDRKLNRQGDVAGILPGPRRYAGDNDTGGGNGVTGESANATDIPAGINELPGYGSTPRQSRQPENGSPGPPPPPKDFCASGLQSSPVSPFSLARTMSINSSTMPTVTVSDTEPSPVDNRSPPFTNSNTPVSPIFPFVSPTFNPRPLSSATTFFPEIAEDKMRKSSKMLPIAGPYLTAERALGDGFWEAEREQEEADREILNKGGMSEDGTMKTSVGSPGDDAGTESESSTGTVIRRTVRNTIG